MSLGKNDVIDYIVCFLKKTDLIDLITDPNYEGRQIKNRKSPHTTRPLSFN